MRSRRLEDRIQELCLQVATAKEPELSSLLTELKAALQEHTLRLRKVAADTLLGAKEKQQRRSA